MVTLLHSYRNRQNEAVVKAIVEEVAPELLTSCSADIWPIIREYERTITATILNPTTAVMGVGQAKH